MKNLETEAQSDNNETIHGKLKRFKKSRLYIPLVTGFIIYEIATKGALIYWGCDKIYDKLIEPSLESRSPIEVYADEAPRKPL